MDTTLLPATIRWSSSRTSTSASACFRCRVKAWSAALARPGPRVVVRDDHGGGMVAQRFAHDFARIDRGLRQSAAREFAAGDQAQLAVQVEADAMLDPPVAQRGLAVLLDAPGWSRAVSRVRSSSMARRASSSTAASMQAFAAPRPGTASSSSGVAPIARAGRKIGRAAGCPGSAHPGPAGPCAGRWPAVRHRSGRQPVTQQPFTGTPVFGQADRQIHKRL